MLDELSDLIEHCPDAMVVVDADGRIELFNGLAEQLFGHRKDDVIGQPIETLIPERFRAGHHGHTVSFFFESSNRPMGVGLELFGQRTDGTEFPVEISLSPLDTPSGPKALSAVRDITERKREQNDLRRAKETAEHALADLTAAKENLVQAEKMASLGQLTAGIAHEIKNPLNFVNNFAETSVELLDDLGEIIQPALPHLTEDDREEAKDLVETLRSDMATIARHGARADGIMRSMLAHVRDDAEPQTVAINELVDEAYNLAFHSERASNREFNITVERDLDAGLGEIEAYPQELLRVLVNLASNAFHATEARKSASDDAYVPAIRLLTTAVGDNVEIRIRDNGIGIPQKVIGDLFTPFFTTKPAGKGTGLGLSISYDIVVQQHHGAIRVDSEEGEFTEFIVSLPRRHEKPVTSQRGQK